MQVVRDCLVDHTVPMTVLAPGRRSAAFVVQRTFWSLRMDLPSNESLCQVSRDLVLFLTDAGTERLLGRTKPTNVADVVPYFISPTVAIAHEEGEWPDDSVFPDDCTQLLDLDGSLSVLGPSHRASTLTEGLCKACIHYDETVEGMTHICRMIKRPHTRSHLLYTCFNCPVGKQFHTVFKNFKGHIISGRWATVMFATPEIRDVEHAIRWGWSREKYGVKGKAVEDPSGSYKALDLDVVDDSVCKPFFWGMVIVLDCFAEILNTYVSMTEICFFFARLVDLVLW